MRRLACLGVVALLALTGCAPAAPTPTTKLTIGLTYQPDIQFAPIYVAAEEGYFTAAGLDVQIRHHGASESLFGALQAGREQVVFAGGDEMLQARSQGVDVVNIATIYQQYPAAVIVPDTSPIRTAADLKGHSIGLPGEYGENWFALLLLLQQSGLSQMTQSDVTVVSIGYTQQAALMGGKVDAVVGFTNNDVVQFEKAGFPVRTIGVSGLVGVGLGTSDTYLKAQQPALKALWNAIAKALQVCVDNPDRAIADAAKYVPGLDQAANQASARATLAATVKLYGPSADFGRQDGATWATMTTFMQEAGLLNAPVTATDAYTTSIVGG